MFTYPSTDYQNPSKLLGMLGSIWSRTYDGREFVKDRLAGQGDRYQQAVSDLQETAAAISRQTVPVYHVEDWFAISIKESELNNNRAALWKFDNGEVFDSELKFDTARSDEYTIELPSGLISVPFIMNRLTEPSVVLLEHIDYRISLEGQALSFLANPFENDGIPAQSLFVDGLIADREIILWLHRSSWDQAAIYLHFGYVLGLPLPSSEAYRSLVNVVFDAITGCSAREQVENVIAISAGIPLVVNASEVVEDIYTGSNNVQIITDQQVYNFAAGVTPTVAVGDTVVAGSSMIDGLEILDFHRGVLDSDLRALVLGAGQLSADFLGELVFENKDVDLHVDGQPGSEKISFEIGGYPGDVDMFWEIVHARRLVYGASLYELMHAAGLDTPTINPAEFLVANILRNNYLGFRIKTASCGENALDFNPIDILREILPPQAAVLLIIELAPLSQSVTMDAVSEVLATFDAVPSLSTTVTRDAVTADYFTSKHNNFTCY